MKEITYRRALWEALSEEMARDKSVFLMGEDMREGGGFGVTVGLVDQFGPERVINTPISEAAITGCGVGAAVMGMRPVVEIMFADFLSIALDQIATSASKMAYLYCGEVPIPLVIRTAYGAGFGGGLHHSQSTEGWFVNIPGLTMVMPSTPYDAKGLLKAAIRENNPVLFWEHKQLYRQRGPVPEGDYTVPIGRAEVKREGKDATVIAIGFMVDKALRAADFLAKEGLSVEVLDPRTILPLDKETIIGSVAKTRRVVIVHEAPKTGGIGAEIAATIVEDGFGYLAAPIKRVAAPDVPVPRSQLLEKEYLPNEEKIMAAVKSLF